MSAPRMDEEGGVCGTCHPPADDTPEREAIDRFRDFLQAAGPPARPDADGNWPERRRPAHEVYHLRFLAWRVGAVGLMPWEPSPSGGADHDRR